MALDQPPSGGLLGWIAGELAVTDPSVHHLIPPAQANLVEWTAAIIGGVLAIGVGWYLPRRQESHHGARGGDVSPQRKL